MSDNLTVKERLLNAIKGDEVDRTPWSPFLAYYWENLPEHIRTAGQVNYLQELGADPLLRGFHELSKSHYKKCQISNTVSGNHKMTSYETPVGTLKETYTYTPDSNSWFLTDHPVKTQEDLKILQFLYENMELSENYEDFRRDSIQLGENGLYVPVIGTGLKTGFQSLVEHWCGTVNLTYALYDYPETATECLAVIRAKDMESVKIAAASDAEAFIFWEDSSTTNISPDFFLEYASPIINEWGKLLHANGKLLIHHACGHLKDLLPLMANTEIDMIESISPPPTGNVDIKDAFSALPPSIGLIGGIEPTFFLNCSTEELDERVRYLIDISHGKKYILANSDSCPPGVEYEKFRMVSELVRSNK